MAMEESLMVALRIKPCNEKTEWNIQSNTIKRTNSNEELSFDTIYDRTATNEDIYGKSIEHLVDDALNGYNVAICAYGQSGAGKTHTLTGTNSFGLVHLLFNDLFSRIALDKRKYLIRVSYLEIFNEKVRDLLGNGEDLLIMERKDIPFVQGISEQVVTSKEEVEDLLFTASEMRQVGETNLNERSSRSHAILRICLESNDGIGSENGDATAGLVNRQKEGANINKSLLALTKVIAILSDKRRCSGHIPYRDSKLTRILKPCLGGNSKTLVICCINPQFITETCSTLKFAKQVKLVKSRPTVNVSTEEGVLAKYLAEIEALKQQLETQKSEPANAIKESDHLEAERERLKSLMKSIINEKENAVPQTKRVQNRRMTWAPGNGKLGSDSPPSKIFRSGFNNIAEQDESDKFSEFLARMENKNHSFDRISEESEDKTDDFDNLILRSNRCSDVMEAFNNSNSKVEVKSNEFQADLVKKYNEALVLMDELRTTLSTLTTVVDIGKESITQLELEKSELEMAVLEQDKVFQTLVSENEKLQQQLKEDQETKNERQLLRDHRDNLTQEVSQLKEKLVDAENTKEALESSLEAAKFSLENQERNNLFEKKCLSEENNQLNNEISQLKREMEHISMKLQMAQEQESSDDRCKKMELTMDSMKKDFDIQLNELKQAKERKENELQEQLMGSNDLIKHLQKQIGSLEEINQLLIANEKAAEMVIPEHQILIDRIEVDQMNSQISQLKQLLNEQEVSTASLKRKLEGSERSFHTINSENRRRTEMLAAKDKMIQSLTEAKHELEVAVSALKSDVGDLNAAREDLDKMTSSYQKLQGDFKEQLETVRRAQDRTNSLAFEKAKAEADLTILRQDYRRLEEKLEKVRDEERHIHENSVAELKEKVVILEESKTSLTNDCNYLQQKLNEKERVHARLIKRCAEIDSGNAVNTASEESLKQHKSQIDFLTDSLNIERTSKKDSIDKLNVELNNKTEEVNDLKAQIEELNKQKRRGIRYMKELETKVKTYESNPARNPLGEIQKS
ncbi:unnamed protein product [Auanema sp. JU1783]|nr:unnamed protein product [Auanema sp. JU1783]